MISQPLPRSLDPLSHESLPGFVLRLAHRLALSPTRLAILTGLNSRKQSTVASSRILTLDPDMAATFATATRLSLDEVHALTLASLARRYPPLSARFLGRQRQTHGLFIAENWVFARCTRYCPECLAGDASTIQQRHGGAWSKLWRLPVVFACPTHQRLLRHTCPSCHSPVHHRRSGSPQLLPLAAHPVIHPAECRNPISAKAPYRPCGQRLDDHAGTPQPPPDRAGHDPLRLQQRILHLLCDADPDDLESVAQPTTAPRFFVDLRVLCCLLQASWPAGRDLVAHPAHADVLDRHVHQVRQQIASIRATGRRAVEIVTYDKPPLHPEPCAILLTTADRVLAAGDAATVRQLLRPLIDAAPFVREWIRRFLAGDGYCSPGLQTAAGTDAGAQHVIKRTGVQPRALQPPPRPVRFGPQHIPQYLPSKWYHEYFAAFTDLPERFLRRAVTVLLARICAGGGIRSAGPRLGLSWGISRHAVLTVTTQLRRESRLAAFNTALDALADMLHTSVALVDYGRRRQALADWSLAPQQWHDLTDDLVGKPVNGKASLHIDWSDRKRLLASVWIWTRVTQGEPYSAPHLRPDPNQPKPGGDLPTYVLSRWPFITIGYGHYAELRHRLDKHSDDLANQIDRRQPQQR